MCTIASGPKERLDFGLAVFLVLQLPESKGNSKYLLHGGIGLTAHVVFPMFRECSSLIYASEIKGSISVIMSLTGGLEVES